MIRPSIHPNTQSMSLQFRQISGWNLHNAGAQLTVLLTSHLFNRTQHMADTSPHVGTISSELSLKPQQVNATAALLAEGATVPFIARYRKEKTGSLDEVQITAIRDRLEKLAELDARKETILASLEERELLTDELKSAVAAAASMRELEDVYLPYRPKRRTRGTIAKEKGLEPLADLLERQDSSDPKQAAKEFVNAEKGVESVDDALAGARDIIAERLSDDPAIRASLRNLFKNKAEFKSKLARGKSEAEAEKFRDYFDWTELAKKAPSHRVLALFRGEAEGFLSVSLKPDDNEGIAQLQRRVVTGNSPAAQQVAEAAEDAYKRLISSSLENELRQELKQKADQKAIQVFVDNLRELLLAPPLGQKAVLGVDPAFRTGCKLVCLDRQGKLLHNDVIYPHSGKEKEATDKVLALCHRFAIEAIAIGNGTASRETETFIRGLGLPSEIAIVMVNESGASVYSASEAAREEFPDHDLTVRGAVSIGRRLMDPLAELVKIDPKSIGVGQYQHDVDQKELRKSLDDTVVSCVNNVGVEVNTASKQLLSYVSGLNATTAQNIVAHREKNGPFATRKQLLKVPRLGPKAYEQAAGFLRIRDAKNPLDASAVHPESYHVVDAMAKDLNASVNDLISDESLRKQIKLERYVSDNIGMPTLTDIVAELAKPGRDPREGFEVFQFAEGVNTMNDLEPGMKLPGIVTNVTAFGAFVDVGVHQDGLVHISQLADRFVNDPNDVVKVHQKVEVTVMNVEPGRKRISLSMKKDPFAPPPQRRGSRGGNRNRDGGNRGNRGNQAQSRDSGFGGGWFDDALKKDKR